MRLSRPSSILPSLPTLTSLKRLMTSSIVLTSSLLLTVLAPISIPANADEWIRPLDVIKSEGYQPVIPMGSGNHQLPPLEHHRSIPNLNPLNFPFPYAKNSLPWPVEFRNGKNSLGNLMMQFQYYGGSPYFHGGCDLVTRAGKPVIAPVSGRIEAGYYSYSHIGDGLLQKHWLPLFNPEGRRGNPMYFEVAIVDDFGLRHEYHHVNANSLQPEILTLIKDGGRITVGTELAAVMPWPESMNGHPYDHVHYNIIDPEGRAFNCQWASHVVEDDLAPEIINVFAVDPADERAQKITEQPAGFSTRLLVVSVRDFKNENPYVHQPHFIELSFSSGERITMDFRQSLLGQNGRPPRLSEVYARRLSLKDGTTLTTQGNYRHFRFLMKLNLDPDIHHGEAHLVVKDAADNVASWVGVINAP